jgi:hypothetical protein
MDACVLGDRRTLARDVHACYASPQHVTPDVRCYQLDAVGTSGSMPGESAAAPVSGAGARCMTKSRVVGIEVNRTGGRRRPEGVSLGIKPAFLQG